MHHVEDKSALTVGITGTVKGVGVAELSRKLAQVCVNQGKSVLLVDASKQATVEKGSGGVLTATELLGHCRNEGGLQILDAGAIDGRMPSSGDAMRHLFRELSNGMTVIVSLPPILATSGATRSWQVDAAAACDIAYLVCLGGVTRKRQLADCMEMSRIFGLKVGGIISNDRNLFGSRQLAARGQSPTAATTG